MSLHDDLKRAKGHAIDDSKGVHEDTTEAVDFVIQMLKDKNFTATAIEMDGYISQAIAVTNIMERWENYAKRELLNLLGEDDEGLVKILPTFIMARILQNFEKRRNDERSE